MKNDNLQININKELGKMVGSNIVFSIDEWIALNNNLNKLILTIVLITSPFFMLVGAMLMLLLIQIFK